MSINYCTLASSTVDAFCNAQRAKVVQRLLLQKYGTPPQVTKPVGPNMPQHVSVNDRQVYSYEQPYITVVVSNLLGSKGAETLQVTPQVAFATISNLSIDSPSATVNN